VEFIQAACIFDPLQTEVPVSSASGEVVNQSERDRIISDRVPGLSRSGATSYRDEPRNEPETARSQRPPKGPCRPRGVSVGRFRLGLWELTISEIRMTQKLSLKHKPDKGFLQRYSVHRHYLLQADPEKGVPGLRNAEDEKGRPLLIKNWPRIASIDDSDLHEVAQRSSRATSTRRLSGRS
jgi:hypothetical protein